MALPPRPLVTLVVVTVGYGVTVWAWTLIGPLGLIPGGWSGLGGASLTALAAVVVGVGSLGRLPVGILTDRYGGRFMLSAVAAVSAVPVLALGVIGEGLVLIPVAVLLGVSGTTFAIGCAVVIRAYPPARRGLALTVYGAGMGIAGAGGLAAPYVSHTDRQRVLPLLALALVGYAVLAAAVIRDRPVRPARPEPVWRTALDLLRFPVTRQLAGWYAVAFGGLIALALYLPAFLRQGYGWSGEESALFTAGCLALAAFCRPVAGWLCQRHEPLSVLATCLGGTGGLGLVLAFQPPLSVTMSLLLVIAALLGAASGVVQALMGLTAPPDRAGAVAGVVGAVGGLVGLVPPLVLAAVRGVHGSYAIGLTLLAGATLACAAYLRRHGRFIAAALAFPAVTSPPYAATTVVALPALPDVTRTAKITAALATLATRHELVIVCCADRDPRGGYAIVTGLRQHLPRFRVISIAAGPDPHVHPHEITVIAELLNSGCLPVVLTAGANPYAMALRLAGALGTDHVLRVHHDQMTGVALQPPWATGPPALADRS